MRELNCAKVPLKVNQGIDLLPDATMPASRSNSGIDFVFNRLAFLPFSIEFELRHSEQMHSLHGVRLQWPATPQSSGYATLIPSWSHDMTTNALGASNYQPVIKGGAPRTRHVLSVF
jgi:hypothetical protein